MSNAMTGKSVFSNIGKYGMIIALVAAMALFGFLTDWVLLSPINLTNLILQNSYVLILATGMLLCTLTGNIDLSVGSVVALVGAVVAILMVTYGASPFVAIIAGLLSGALIGAWQGFWIAFIKIPAFIVTLAGMLVFRGLTLVILQGQTKGPFPESFQAISSGFIGDIVGTIKLGSLELHGLTIVIGILIIALIIYVQVSGRVKRAKLGANLGSQGLWIAKIAALIAVVVIFTMVFASYKGIPNILILLGVLIAAYQFITVKTIPGRHIYALGGNAKAAKLSGVKTEWVMFWVYTNMGILSAVAGMVFSARLNASTPTAGNMFELDAIAACYVGGSSVTGGVGTIIGAIVGGLFMGVLNNGMSLMGIGIDYQQTIKGLILLAAVAFDLYSKSKKTR
jgi:putative multiple sugar transport system permease protein